MRTGSHFSLFRLVKKSIYKDLRLTKITCLIGGSTAFCTKFGIKFSSAIYLCLCFVVVVFFDED